MRAERELDPPLSSACRAFEACFGGIAACAARAPGRVNLIGEHVDYSGGFVLPMAIDRSTLLLAAPARGTDGSSRIRSSAMTGEVSVRLSSPLRRTDTFADRVLGVIEGFRRHGAAIPELDLLVESSVPIGGGLSSSAALEVATATLLESITGLALSTREKALLCQRAEHEFAGVPAGIMDMFVSIAARQGHALHLDCRSLEFELVPMSSRLCVVVVDTCVKHDLADGAYALRRRQCEEAAAALGVESLRDASEKMVRASALGEPVRSRALHATGENRRVQEFVAALRREDFAALGPLLFASHASLRDLYEVSCPELDAIVEDAAALHRAAPDEILGARLTGGGFGGCAILLCHAEAAARAGDAIRHRFRERFAREPNVFVVHASDGAKAEGIEALRH